MHLPQNLARWLAGQLGYPHLLLSPKAGHEAKHEALAWMSRFPLEDSLVLDLGGQGRIAQRVRLTIEGRAICLANTHLYWQPGESLARLRQVEQMLDWLQGLPGDPPCVVCGDFNATPETQAIWSVCRNRYPRQMIYSMRRKH